MRDWILSCLTKIESVILYWSWDSGLAGPVQVDVAEAELVIHVKCQIDVVSEFMVVELRQLDLT